MKSAFTCMILGSIGLSCAHLSGVTKAQGNGCPSDVSLSVRAPNERWVRAKAADGSLTSEGWCGHDMFTHTSRSAKIGIGFLPWPESAPDIAKDIAAQYDVYDNNTGEGALMDQDEADDGYSWAFVHLQVPGESGPDRVFQSFLKDSRRPDIVIVVTGYWPARDNFGLIGQLTLFTENIDLLVEE